jgi:hypothetical protein
MLQGGKFRKRWQVEDLMAITLSLPACFCSFCTFRSKSGAISLQLVPESRYCDVLEHITPIFLRDEPLSQCFPPCTTGRRERDFREYADMQLRSGFCVMALEGSSVVGACLSRPLTRDQVMGCSMPSSVGPGMGRCYKRMCMQTFCCTIHTRRWASDGLSIRDRYCYRMWCCHIFLFSLTVLVDRSVFLRFSHKIVKWLINYLDCLCSTRLGP